MSPLLEQKCVKLIVRQNSWEKKRIFVTKCEIRDKIIGKYVFGDKYVSKITEIIIFLDLNSQLLVI